MNWQKTVLLLLFLLVLGGVLRFTGFTKNPNSLNIDEVSIGYNAYSILKTGKDEYGTFMPLSFKSVGDYKPPILIYMTVPSVALFGLNELGVRFPTALMGTLSILILFLLIYELTRNKSLALLSAGFLAISPWHIYFSRYASESLNATAFTMLGFYFLLKLRRGNFLNGVWAALFLGLAMYTYHTQRLFVPMMVVATVALYWREYKHLWKWLVMSAVIMGVLVAPLLYSTAFGPDKTRAQSTFITQDVELVRNVWLQASPSWFDLNSALLVFYWARKFLHYFDPAWLFFSGLGMTQDGSYGLGIMYLFELPLLLLGIWKLIKVKSDYRWWVALWLGLGLIPASLTQNEQHALRTLVMIPAFILISSLGLQTVFEYWKTSGKSWLLRFSLVAFLGLVCWNLLFALMVFTVHFPKERGEAFMEGSKPAVQYALDHQSKYQEIIFDPVRGVDGPFVVSIPHMYVLFQSQYDPTTYQTEPKRHASDAYGFNKYTIRRINWAADQNLPNRLLVGSPWSFPDSIVNSPQVVQKVYLANGKLAFLLVETGKSH